jgi:hypothetical protein
MTTSTQKLIQTLESNSVVIEGKISTAKDGVKYRYDMFVLKYENAANWLVSLFEKAVLENGVSKYSTQFISGDYSFHYDRPKFKGTPNGKIKMTKLIEIN